MSEEFQVPDLLGLGLRGDSMPCNWGRSESVHAFTLNFPGLVGEWSSVRFPVCGLFEKFIMEHTTFDSIMEVVQWGFQCLLTGQVPTCRHD
eukprot:7412383-Alexandrium_andersonii.AAC.1